MYESPKHTLKKFLWSVRCLKELQQWILWMKPWEMNVALMTAKPAAPSKDPDADKLLLLGFRACSLVDSLDEEGGHSSAPRQQWWELPMASAISCFSLSSLVNWPSLPFPSWICILESHLEEALGCGWTLANLHTFGPSQGLTLPLHKLNTSWPV